MMETATARSGILCCVCGHALVQGDRVLRFHLPQLVALMLDVKNHSLAWLYLCCDCVYTGYSLFDYGLYHFDPEEEVRLAALVTPDTLALCVKGGVWRQVCGRCDRDLTNLPARVHEGVALCPTCDEEVRGPIHPI